VLAHSYREAGEGWSFVMWSYPNGRENKRRPRIRITAIDSHRAIIILTGGRLRNKDGTPAPCGWPIPGGRFLDLAHMVFALRNSLEFKVLGKLEGHEPTGKVTSKEIRYARRDVQATLNLLNAVKREFDSFGLSTRPEQVLSPASLTKGFLKDMELTPPKIKFQGVSDHILGCAAQAYYGGRVECRIRH